MVSKNRKEEDEQTGRRTWVFECGDPLRILFRRSKKQEHKCARQGIKSSQTIDTMKEPPPSLFSPLLSSPSQLSIDEASVSAEAWSHPLATRLASNPARFAQSALALPHHLPEHRLNHIWMLDAAQFLDSSIRHSSPSILVEFDSRMSFGRRNQSPKAWREL
jgi:hypothetical protein